MSQVTLYFEEGPGIGLGHRRRMEALGAALRRRGATVELRSLDATDPSRLLVDDASVARVIDAYLVRADDPLFGGTYVVALDDLDRDLDVDMVVHPAPLADPDAPQCSPRVLAGLEFALLAALPAADGASAPNAVADPVRTVLVTLGASDSAGLGAQVCEQLVARMPTVQVRHVAGPWSVRSESPAVVSVDAPDGLGDELTAADLVVTAGGVTMLEALASGRPTVVLPTADNQSRAVDAVRDAQAAVVVSMGSTPAQVVDAIVRLTADVEQRRALAVRASKLVDGRGADRVAGAILELI